MQRECPNEGHGGITDQPHRAEAQGHRHTRPGKGHDQGHRRRDGARRQEPLDGSAGLVPAPFPGLAPHFIAEALPGPVLFPERGRNGHHQHHGRPAADCCPTDAPPPRENGGRGRSPQQKYRDPTYGDGFRDRPRTTFRFIHAQRAQGPDGTAGDPDRFTFGVLRPFGPTPGATDHHVRLEFVDFVAGGDRQFEVEGGASGGERLGTGGNEQAA